MATARIQSGAEHSRADVAHLKRRAAEPPHSVNLPAEQIRDGLQRGVGNRTAAVGKPDGNQCFVQPPVRPTQTL